MRALGRVSIPGEERNREDLNRELNLMCETGRAPPALSFRLSWCDFPTFISKAGTIPKPEAEHAVRFWRRPDMPQHV